MHDDVELDLHAPMEVEVGDHVDIRFEDVIAVEQGSSTYVLHAHAYYRDHTHTYFSAGGLLSRFPDPNLQASAYIHIRKLRTRHREQENAPTKHRRLTK